MLLGLLGFVGAVHAVPTTDGLYATFQVKRGATALGEFSCKLAFDKAPRTVANFVGLAEGSLPFIDFQRARLAKRPFYNGIKFHRVVPNFVIQAGSPNGQGTDGPGYTFPDEFNATLRHSKAGILSMANSGPHSNGSQFFVTLAATPHLDDLHSVFGEVLEGMTVVTSVQQGDVIASVTITRNGAAASAFDVTAQGVPLAQDNEPRLGVLRSAFQLEYPQAPNSEVFVFHSDDLATWATAAGKELYTSASTPLRRDVSALTAQKNKKFFQVARVQYPGAIHIPPTVTGKKLTLTDAGNFALAFTLATANSGTYTFTQGAQVAGPFPVSAYVWNQEAYRGQFSAAISGLTYGGRPVVQAGISFVFSSATAGTYRGSLINDVGQSLAIGGTFAVTTP